MVWVVNASPWRLFPREKLRTDWGNKDGTQDGSRRILAKIKSLALLGIELRAVQPITSIGVDIGISLSYRNNTCMLHRQSARVNTLRTGLLNCLNARSPGLTFRHRASCI